MNTIDSHHIQIDRTPMTARDWFVAAIISLAIFAVHWMLIKAGDINVKHYYARMANNPFGGEIAPFGYRVLTSWLVYFLPLSIENGFKAVNFTAIVLTGIILVRIGKSLGLRGALPFITPIPYLLSHGVHWQLQAIAFQDPLTHLFLALAVLAFLYQRDDWISCVSAFGAANRITALFFMPAWYVCLFGWRVNWKSIKRLLVVWGPAIAVIIIIRHVWHPETAQEARKFGAMVLPWRGFFEFYFQDFFKQNPTVSVLVFRLVSFHTADIFFGVLLPLYLVYLFRCPSSHRRLSLFSLIIWMQFFIATDTFRLETNAFPVLIPLALLHYQQLTAGIKNRITMDVALGAFIFILTLYDSIFKFTTGHDFKKDYFNFPPALVGGFFLLAASWYIHKRFPPPLETSNVPLPKNTK